jgi:hypothetical protein
MSMRRANDLGWTQISLSRLRSLLRNLLRRRSLPLTNKKIIENAALRLINAPQREKFFSPPVQNSSIHAMVAGNER